MRCIKCGHGTYRSTNTEAVELAGGCLLIIRNIPCYKCGECDEIMYTGDVVERLERLTAKAVELAQELTIVDYAKAA
ncbi:MAG: YgiT-type zinc finger protein [Oscillospiraceae bacterium]|nr:YgiT-type zinc finger protein [Oscillospiraceae bacterium]